MNRSTLLLCILLAAGFVFGCAKQSVQATYDKQEDNIAKFIEAQTRSDTNATVTYKNGTVRLTLHDTLDREGLRADSLAAGGTVSFYYAGYVLKGTSVSKDQLFATNHKSTADAAGWMISDTTAFRIETLSLDKDNNLLPGLYYGLEGVRNQDECFILFSGKYGYGSHVQGTIPARSALVYHIWVSSISND